MRDDVSMELDSFAKWILARVVQPMVGTASLDGEELSATVVRDPDLADPSSYECLRIENGWLRNEASTGRHVYWARVKTRDEMFEFALGFPAMEVSDLNDQVRDFGEELQAWLSETTLAWGQLRHVPEVVITENEEIPQK